jgi:hypothetical protein
VRPCLLGVVLALAGLAGCLVDPIDLNDRKCDDDHACVDGYTCIEGECEDDDGSSSG